METKTLQHLRGSEFDKEILQSKAPAVVDFYADWCGPCRIVSPIIESLAREYEGKAKFAKVDTDANQDLAERYGVMSIPTVFIFKDGEVKERIVGAAPAGSYRKKIESVIRS
jgi:thioredoxin 1